MGVAVKPIALMLALIASGCAYQGMEDLSDFSLGQYEAMKIALEEARISGKGVAFQRNVEIRHRNCTDEKADLVKCSYEMRQPLDMSSTTFTEWKPVKRTFKNIFWTRSWVEAEAPSRQERRRQGTKS